MLRTQRSQQSAEYRLFSAAPAAYALTLSAVVVCILLRLMLEPLTGSLSGYLYFLPAVVLGAAYGGAGPAVCATLLGAAVGLMALSENGISAREMLIAFIFVLNGLLIALIGAQARYRHQAAIDAASDIAAREAHLKSILETVPDAMVLVDAAGTIISFSSTAEKLFLWSADEAAGQNISMLIPHWPPRRRTHGRHRASTALRKDGSQIAVELVIGEVAATPRLLTCFIHDLTERKKYDDQVKTLQGELLQVSRLSAMGEMAAMLAHELNQPLAAIVNLHGAAERRIDKDPSEPAAALKESLQDAAAQALRAGNIIRRIRQFVDKGEIERKPVVLQEIIPEVLGFALIGQHATRIRSDIQLEADMRPVLADSVQLQQVLLNIIRNAVEALGDFAGARLDIRARTIRRKFVEISIADNGPGISPDIHPKLFEVFFTTKGDGMGIGLSICRTIVEAHGGKIWIEPNTPTGSIFKFTLPLIKDEDEWHPKEELSPSSMTTAL
jgi:two-component system sensor kinase FixL